MDRGLIEVRRKKILILDDETETLELLTRRLETHGYDIYTGVDGLEGLVKLRNEMPDLIILDVMMPKIDGIEFFKILKQSKEYSKIPIIILTAKHDMRETFMKLGADYFATKPFISKEIVEKIQALVRQKVLVVGDSQEFQEMVSQSFPGDAVQLTAIPYPNEMFQRIAKEEFALVVVRLAQIESDADEFMKDIRGASMDPKLTVMTYCDEDSKQGDVKEISALELEWVKQGQVVFYDLRLNKGSLGEFVERELLTGNNSSCDLLKRSVSNCDK